MPVGKLVAARDPNTLAGDLLVEECEPGQALVGREDAALSGDRPRCAAAIQHAGAPEPGAGRILHGQQRRPVLEDARCQTVRQTLAPGLDRQTGVVGPAAPAYGPLGGRAWARPSQKPEVKMAGGRA